MDSLLTLAQKGIIYDPTRPVKFESRLECSRCSKVNKCGCTICENCKEPLTSPTS